MTNYEKLVEALRILQDKNSLSYYKRQVCKDAAAAIEELQAEVKELKEQLNDADIAADDNGRQVEEMQAEVKQAAKRNAELHAELEKWVSAAEQAGEPKRGKWITIRLNNGGSYTGCSCCEAPIPTDTMLDYIPESESKYCYSCGAKMMEVQDG